MQSLHQVISSLCVWFFACVEVQHVGKESVMHKIGMFGPYSELGLGKPSTQNFLSQFLDSLYIQTIDANQDNVLSQSFFIPNLLQEFQNNNAGYHGNGWDNDVKILSFPEYSITSEWSKVGWCASSSFAVMQRTIAQMECRGHYGHPDVFDASFVMVFISSRDLH
jgi:hypothetical protein